MARRLANDARLCKRCSAEAVVGEARCALCAGPVTTARTMRLLGWMLVLIGSFLLLFMGAITYYVARIVYHADASGARFNGSPEMALYIFALFGLVMLFGFSAVVSGALQALSARPNRKIMLVIIGLGVLIVAAGVAVTLTKH